MKVAICFFGEMTFIDRFMIQNFMRCVVTPLWKYNTDDVDFYYFLHTFFDVEVFKYIELMRNNFCFESITLHNENSVLNKKHTPYDNNLYLECFSLQYVKKMWKSIKDLDLVVYVRLDALFTKPLSNNDIDAMTKNKMRLFINDTPKINNYNPIANLRTAFVAGDPVVMEIYADRIHYDENHTPDNEEEYISFLKIQHNFKVSSMSVVFVRVMPDALVCSQDYTICPYLADLVSSSSTDIRILKRKNSLK